MYENSLEEIDIISQTSKINMKKKLSIYAKSMMKLKTNSIIVRGRPFDSFGGGLWFFEVRKNV